jgi:hypothetical protein
MKWRPLSFHFILHPSAFILFFYAAAAVLLLCNCTSPAGAAASQVVGQTPQRVQVSTDGQGAVERAACERRCSFSRKGRPMPESTISQGRTSS